MAGREGGLRWPAILGLSALVVLLACGVTMAAAVAASGVATVYVQDPDEGLTLYVPLPAAVIEGGSIVASVGLPDAALAELRREVGELGPRALELLRALEEGPDGLLVEVEEPGTSVRVEKRGGHLRVAVDEDGGTTVRVSVPLGAARRSAARLLG